MSEPTTKTFFKAVNASHFFKTMELVAIEIPELETEDGSVAVVYGKPISGKAALAIGRSKDGQMEVLLSRVVCQSIFNAQGERIFTDEQGDNLADLISAPVFNRLAAGVGAINKVKDGQQQEEGQENGNGNVDHSVIAAGTGTEDDNAPRESPEKKD